MKCLIIIFFLGDVFLTKRKKASNEIESCKSPIKRIKTHKEEKLSRKLSSVKDKSDATGITPQQLPDTMMLRSGSLKCNQEFNLDDVSSEIRIYKSCAIKVDKICYSNPCMVQDILTTIDGAAIMYTFVKASKDLTDTYQRPNPIFDGIYTANSILDNPSLAENLEIINRALNFKSISEKVDKDSIEPYLKDVKGADLIYTNRDVALQAFKILLSGELTKSIASENLAKLLLYASRRDVMFVKSDINILIKNIKQETPHCQIGRDIRENNPLTLIYLFSTKNEPYLPGFTSLFVTQGIKVSAILYSIYASLKTKQLHLLCLSKCDLEIL